MRCRSFLLSSGVFLAAVSCGSTLSAQASREAPLTSPEERAALHRSEHADHSFHVPARLGVGTSSMFSPSAPELISCTRRASPVRREPKLRLSNSSK